MKSPIVKKLYMALLLPGLFFFAQVPSAFAADILLEVFYLPHAPAMAVVNEVEKVASEFPDLTLKRFNFEDPASRPAIESHKLTAHIPVAIFINGQDTFTVGGKTMTFRNFPKGNAFVPMFAGEWDYSDLRTILAGVSKGK